VDVEDSDLCYRFARGHHAAVDCERAYRGGDVPAVTAAVDDRAPDIDLGEVKVDVGIGSLAGSDDRHLAREGMTAAYAVALTAAGVRAPHCRKEDRVLLGV